MQIVEVTDFGVRSAVIRLRRRDTPLQFVLYPMLHMAKPGFYAAVASRLRTAQVIVAEGVRRGASGHRSVLVGALTLSYTALRLNVSGAGLVEQDIDYDEYGVPVINPDVDADQFRTGWRRVPLFFRLAMWCALPVIVLIRVFGGTGAIWTRAMAQDDLPSDEDEELESFAPELAEAFGGERDKRLLAALGTLHEERGSEAIEVAVVYGAAHVPSIVNGLRDRYGYRARAADWLTVVDLTDAPAKPERVAVPIQRTVRNKPTVRPEPAAPTPPPTVDSVRAKVEQVRGLVELHPQDYLPRLADALIELSDTLADQGRPTEALEAADEAVDIAESLRDRHGDSYNPRYGWAAYTLGQRLNGIGRGDDATVLYGEAVDVFRTTYRNDPYQRARSLGAAVTDYAGQLNRRERYDEAVAASQEAIELFRAARPEARDDFNRPWAFALRNLAIALRSLGRADESLEAARRGVHLARTLLPGRPDQAGILVDNLRQCAHAYELLDRRDEALDTGREAVEVARTIGQRLAPDDREHLGRALDTLVWILRWLDRSADALPVAAEVVTVWRSVAGAHPAECSSLARALSELAGLQEELGTADHGLAAAEEAEAIARELAQSNPDGHGRLLADVLLRIWRCYKSAGQSERAMEATSEAVTLLRADRERQPADG